MDEAAEQRRGARTGAVPGVALVGLAAALWGTDGLFRRGLALELPAATVVIGVVGLVGAVGFARYVPRYAPRVG